MSPLRILHVDDEPDIRELVALSLCLDPDLAVKSCASGTDALAEAATWSPDVILMDVMMPVMDGPETLAHLRESDKTAGIPVVFMTARAQSRELAHFLSLGAAGVIAKPFDPMGLAGAVRGYLHHSEIAFDGLKRKFVARVLADATALAAERARMVTDPAAACEEAEQIAHGLVGAAGIHGFREVGLAAAALQRVAERARDGGTASREVVEAIDRLAAAIAREMSAAAAPNGRR
jgi:CheY-like chemotaxis protein